MIRTDNPKSGPKPAPQRSRDPLFDIAKALLMLWVVWGHLGLYGIVGGGSSRWMANAKIGMNMPAFFLVGGYFARRTFERASFGKIVARVVSFLWPMAAFGILFGIVLCLEGEGEGLVWLARFVRRRLLYGHWFLRTFAAVYACSAIAWRLLPRPWMKAVGFAALYAALIFLPPPVARFVRYAGIHPMVHMLPFFVFGLAVPRAIEEIRRRTRLAVPCLLFFLAVVFLEGDSATNGMNFWNVSMAWRDIFLSGRGLLAFVGRTAVGLAGSLAAVFVLDRLLRRIPKGASRMAVFGTTTLGVYVLHEWPMMQASKTLFTWLPLPGWTRWFVALACFLVCHAIVSTIKHAPVLDAFFFGNETWLVSLFGKLRTFRQHSAFPSNRDRKRPARRTP